VNRQQNCLAGVSMLLCTEMYRFLGAVLFLVLAQIFFLLKAIIFRYYHYLVFPMRLMSYALEVKLIALQIISA
jgi:hypothetical protein